MLKRQTYLNWLISSKDNEFIKVITGVRRSGKSVILRLYQDYLLEQGVLAENIIFYNFEHPDNFDIYITGSNANLLSGGLATYLAGRYMEMTVYPLSFAEFVAFSRELGNTKHDELLFQEYLKWGGFPNLPSIDNELIKRDILKGIYSSIVLKDVASRGAIREMAMLERVIAYLLDIIGQSVSVKKIADTLTSAGTKANSTSIDNYIGLLKESFIFYEANRYDIRGKARLKTGAKYYVVDTGLRNTVLGQVGNLGSQLENIIFMELKRRGYEVFVGKLDSEEIDFVCFRGEEKEYFQVAYQLPVDSDREQRNLLHITDNYKKTIITLNRMDVGVIEGIQVVHAVDWLLVDS